MGLIQQGGPARSEHYGQVTNVFPGVTTADEVVKVDDGLQRPVTMASCERGHEYPAMAGECPYCLPDDEVQAPDEQGRHRFASEE